MSGKGNAHVKPQQVSASIQTFPEPVPAVPAWFGEVTVIAQYLRHLGVRAAISERVRFARRRFGHYDVIDFVVVLLGYAISGERTLETFYECLHPFAAPFMVLFGRERLPHRSTLSRFLAATLIKCRSRRYARCFSKTCWLGLWRSRRKQEGCGTGKEPIGRSSTLTARDKPPANEPCLVRLIARQCNAD
jgi:hypothetical protein